MEIIMPNSYLLTLPLTNIFKRYSLLIQIIIFLMKIQANHPSISFMKTIEL